MKKRIVGLTHDGKKFRPSGWAYMIADRYAEHTDRTTRYNGPVRPCRVYGVLSVIFEPNRLTEEELDWLISFAESNHLRIEDVI